MEFYWVDREKGEIWDGYDTIDRVFKDIEEQVQFRQRSVNWVLVETNILGERIVRKVGVTKYLEE